jgi:ribosomal protein S18 acetylase RimI-like enzyme
MKIEHASPEDARAVAEIHVGAWRVAYASLLSAEYLASLSVEKRTRQWAQCIAQGEPELLVAKDDHGAVLGWLSFGKCRDAGASPAEAEIWALYAAPSVWSTGVGRMLWLEARARMRAQGFEACSLWVFPQNERAIRFYRAAGFSAGSSAPQEFELDGQRLQEARYVCRLDG